MSFAAIAGPVAGAVVGGLMSDGGGGSQTASKTPWEPAIKPLTNSLETGQALERYYQQNPFNQMQRTGYQNLYADLDQFRNQIAPGMMQFANSMMQSNYQRGPRQSQMESMQGQMPMQRPQMMQQAGDGVYQTMPMQMPGGQGGTVAYQGSIPQGLLANIPQGPFQAPTPGSYGLLDWVQNNPFTCLLYTSPSPRDS